MPSVMAIGEMETPVCLVAKIQLTEMNHLATQSGQWFQVGNVLFRPSAARSDGASCLAMVNPRSSKRLICDA